MAEIIDLQDDHEGTTDLPTGSNEAPAQVADTASQGQTTESSIPDKYKNKSLDEIVKMHQEAEKLIGRQAQEVGEVRKLADDLIKQQLNTTKQDTQPSTDNEIDYFADPDKAVNYAVENNPIVRQLKEQSDLNQRQQLATQLQSRFPDFQEIVASDDFATWIKSSRVRLDLFAKANNFDMDSAQELLETYTAIKGTKAQQAQNSDNQLIKGEEEKRSQQLRSAAVQKGGSGEVSKPIYRRVDLIRLRMTDPDRYNALQDDIMSAYADGRVK
jgi:hypothetical protein